MEHRSNETTSIEALVAQLNLLYTVALIDKIDNYCFVIASYSLIGHLLVFLIVNIFYFWKMLTYSLYSQLTNFVC